MSFILTIFGVGLFMLFDLKNNKNLLFGIISFLIIIFLFLNNPHIENEKLKKIHNSYN
jgi:multisubunit Na+/H+ antiporter MnhG subunit